MTFPKWCTGRILGFTHKTTLLITIITINYNDGFTRSIPFVKAFHKNVQYVHKDFTV